MLTLLFLTLELTHPTMADPGHLDRYFWFLRTVIVNNEQKKMYQCCKVAPNGRHTSLADLGTQTPNSKHLNPKSCRTLVQETKRPKACLKVVSHPPYRSYLEGKILDRKELKELIKEGKTLANLNARAKSLASLRKPELILSGNTIREMMSIQFKLSAMDFMIKLGINEASVPEDGLSGTDLDMFLQNQLLEANYSSGPNTSPSIQLSPKLRETEKIVSPVIKALLSTKVLSDCKSINPNCEDHINIIAAQSYGENLSLKNTTGSCTTAEVSCNYLGVNRFVSTPLPSFIYGLIGQDTYMDATRYLSKRQLAFFKGIISQPKCLSGVKKDLRQMAPKVNLNRSSYMNASAKSMLFGFESTLQLLIRVLTNTLEGDFVRRFSDSTQQVNIKEFIKESSIGNDSMTRSFLRIMSDCTSNVQELKQLISQKVEARFLESMKNVSSPRKDIETLTKRFCSEALKGHRKHGVFKPSTQDVSRTDNPNAKISSQKEAELKNKLLLDTNVRAAALVADLPFSFLLTLSTSPNGPPLHNILCYRQRSSYKLFSNAAFQMQMNAQAIFFETLKELSYLNGKRIESTAKGEHSSCKKKDSDYHVARLIQVNPIGVGVISKNSFFSSQVCQSAYCLKQFDATEKERIKRLRMALFIGGTALTIATMGLGPAVAGVTAAIVSGIELSSIALRTQRAYYEKQVNEWQRMAALSTNPHIISILNKIEKRYGDNAKALLKELTLELGLSIVPLLPKTLKGFKNFAHFKKNVLRNAKKDLTALNQKLLAAAKKRRKVANSVSTGNHPVANSSPIEELLLICKNSTSKMCLNYMKKAKSCLRV